MDFINEQKFAVQISWWHMDSGYFMFSPGNKPGMNNPISAAEYAENMVSLVKYLLEVKQYTCPIQLSPLNEPYNKILDATGTKFNEELFIDIVEELDRLLKKNGLRDKVKLNLGDAANSEHSAKLIEILGDYADIMNTHNYEFYNNTPNDIMHDWNKMLSDKCREKDIEHAIGEFGTRTMTDYANQFDIDTFERALMLPRFAINSLNGGSVGAIYWVMADTYYKDPSVQMNLGLWKYKDENFELRPQYYSWSLLTRYTERNSDIYPIASEDDQICTCALKNKDGKWSILAVNNNSFEKQVAFIMPPQEKNNQFKLYIFNLEAVPDDKTSDELITVSNTLASDNRVISLVLPSQSFIVISNLE